MANEQEYDLTHSTGKPHRFDKQVGNRLVCTLHVDGSCPTIFVKPTQVLTQTENGLQLVDASEIA